MSVTRSHDADLRSAELVGADLLGLPRTARISVVEFNRATKALTAAIGVHLDPAGFRRSGDAVRVRELARMLSVMSAIRTEHVGRGPLAVPPAMLTRSARCLDLAGDALGGDDLARALHREATALRSRRIG